MIYTVKPNIAIKSGINYFHKSFYYLYISVSVIIFSPLKLLAYFSPSILLLGLILIWPSDKMFRRLLVCLLVAGIIISPQDDGWFLVTKFHSTNFPLLESIRLAQVFVDFLAHITSTILVWLFCWLTLAFCTAGFFNCAKASIDRARPCQRL